TATLSFLNISYNTDTSWPIAVGAGYTISGRCRLKHMNSTCPKSNLIANSVSGYLLFANIAIPVKGNYMVVIGYQLVSMNFKYSSSYKYERTFQHYTVGMGYKF
ncbi:MAG: hypothetical protein GY756_21360, partial [bacterium]|nr:hypothetical protein [bacterium]